MSEQSPSSENGFAVAEHQSRRAFADELHNRPSPVLEPPAHITHFAFIEGAGGAEQRRHIDALCQQYGALAVPSDALHHSADLGEFRFRWEQHTEFSTLTFFRYGAFETPFDEPASQLVPRQWLASFPGKALVAVQMALVGFSEPPSRKSLLTWFEGHRLFGGFAANGKVRLWNSLRIHDDGYARVLAHAADLDAERCGRMVQRVLEIETYRNMALLGLPLARQLAPELRDMEETLVGLPTQMAERRDRDEQRGQLKHLSQLAATTERMVADSAFRFGATRAYADLVSARLRELDMTRSDDVQLLREFIARRFEPAVQTCASVQDRLLGLSERINRAADLLSTRVDLDVEEQNQALLRSMNKRAQLQVRLQETVEGLSVVALTYYAIGLFNYLVQGTNVSIGPLSADLLVAIAVPVTLIWVWLTIKWFKRKMIKERGS
ncbi:MAG: DUF3422 family protein [Geminicoccaceae bacterium]